MVALIVNADFVKLGLITGLTYAVLACGLILIFRATGIINFAHGQLGALGAALLAKLVLDFGWNYLIAAAVALTVAGLLGAVIELTVIRRLFTAPRVIVLVATIGVAQLLFLLQSVLVRVEHTESTYPVAVDRSLQLGNLSFRAQELQTMAVAPLLLIGLGLLLSRTRYGRDVRACADNPDAARLATIRVRRVSTLVWTVAGVLAAAAAILAGPSLANLAGSAQGLDPGLMLKALTVAMVGRLVSLPLALLGGLVVGVTETLIRVNIADVDVVDIVLFGVLLALVLIRARGVEDPSHARTLSPHVKPIPPRLTQLRWVRLLPALAGSAALMGALGLPSIFSSNPQIFLMSEMLIFALVAVSITLMTGWAGQLSLGHFGFVAVGAATAGALSFRGVPFVACLAYAAILGAVAAVAVGLPALRVRGLFLSITTIAFGIAAVGAMAVLLRHHVLNDRSALALPRPVLGPIDFASQRNYYFLCLGVLALVVPAVSRLRRTGIGRSLLAVRDNEINATTMSISATRTKLAAFALSGSIAALAGAMLAGLLVNYGTDIAPVNDSFRVVAIAVIGGLGSVSGALIGAALVMGVPAIFNNAPEALLITSSLFLLVVLMYVPDGIMGAVHRLRYQLLLLAERRLGRAGEPGAEEAVSAPVRPRTPEVRAAVPRHRVAGDAPALCLRDVSVAFGDNQVLDRVSLQVGEGAIVGLIGGNGAGKTTLINVISGLVAAHGGVELHGRDIGGLPAHERARAGIARGFQDARLFTGLTVYECIELALERRQRSEWTPSLLALPSSLRMERRRRGEASEIVAFLSLGAFAGELVSDISTGTRRIAELACLVAMRPSVLLLDEPTAGIAQREAEAFGPLIRAVRAELGASILVVEHDIPLMVSLCDRICCLGTGRVIAEGRPEEVRSDPLVISSYLGTDQRAISRSGMVPV